MDGRELAKHLIALGLVFSRLESFWNAACACRKAASSLMGRASDRVAGWVIPSNRDLLEA